MAAPSGFGIPLELDTSRPQEGGDCHEILLLEFRVPQRQLECCQPLLVRADAPREEEAFGDREQNNAHSSGDV